MKRLLVSIILLILVLGITGCKLQIYQLPDGQFCTSASDGSEIELETEEKEFVINLLNEGKWYGEIAKCPADYCFNVGFWSVKYCCESGVFNDFILHRSLKISDEDRNTVNDFLNCSSKKYKLTVVDNFNYLNSPLNEYYEAGEEVRVYIKFLSGPNGGINLNGENITDGVSVLESGGTLYTFIMPDSDSILYTTQNGATGEAAIDCNNGYHRWYTATVAPLPDGGEEKVLKCFYCNARKSITTYNQGDEHPKEYIITEETHHAQYFCDCPASEHNSRIENHFDSDGNKECDVCSYFVGNKVDGLALGTYYLPYQNQYDPASITFMANGKCEIDFLKEDKPSYYQNYWIEDGRVYLDIDSAPKVHVFTILENALVLDPVLSTANLWGTLSARGPVVYSLPGASMGEILGIIAMADQNLDKIPSVEIYSEYKIGNRYNNELADAYAFMISDESDTPAHSDRILGTRYTFTYHDSREFLIYTRGWVLTLNEAFDRGFITEEILERLNENHHSCKIAHSFDDGVIANQNILYSCRICGATETVSLPEDFSFALSYGFDLYYDSKTGYLKNGYNVELNSINETTLVLTQDELMNIYRILYNGNLLNIRENFDATQDLWVPSYNIRFSYTINGETTEFVISKASYATYSQWEIHSEFCYAYQTVVKEFILDSEEYKSMPPNDNIYD